MTASSIHTEFYLSGPTADLTGLMPRGNAVRNTRNGICILLVTHGEACIRIDEVHYRLSPGSVVVLMPFHFMATGEQSPGFLCRYLCFDFDFMADFPLLIPPEDSERFVSAPCLQTDEEDFAALTRCYDRITEYYCMLGHPYRLGIVKAQLFTFTSDLLFRFTDNARSVRRTRSETLTDEFFRLLHRYHTTERSLAFYAGRLCITTKYLSKVIRRTTGHTVCFWIEAFTVKEAKQLLRTTQKTVTEIAEQLHFANSSFFAKFFRRHAGCSPVEFRRSGIPEQSE